jgi:hypothetical protein
VKVLLVVGSDVGANSVATCGTKITEHNVAVGVKVWRKNDASYLRFKKRNRVICGIHTFILNQSIHQSSINPFKPEPTRTPERRYEYMPWTGVVFYSTV